MPGQSTVIQNMPMLVLWIIAAAQIIFAVSVLMCAVCLVKLLGALLKLVNELTATSQDVHNRLPNLMSAWERRQ